MNNRSIDGTWKTFCSGLIFISILVTLEGCISNSGILLDQIIDDEGYLIEIRKKRESGNTIYQKIIYYPNRELRCIYNVTPSESPNSAMEYLNHGDFVCFYETGDTLSKGVNVQGIQTEKLAFFSDGSLQGRSRTLDDSITYTWVFYNDSQLLQKFKLEVEEDVIYTTGYDSLGSRTYSVGDPCFIAFHKNSLESNSRNRILEFSVYTSTDGNINRKVFEDSIKIRSNLPFLEVKSTPLKNGLVSKFNLTFPDTISFFTLPLMIESEDWINDSSYTDSILIDIKN